MQVTQAQLSEMLGISTRWIQKLSKEKGLFKTKEGGKYNLAACIQEYVEYKVNSETSGANNLDYWEEKAQHEQAKRKITQMKLSRMKRESFDASDVEDAWSVLLLGFKEELQALPHKLTPMLIGLDNMAEIDRIIENEVNNALLELSNFDLDRISGEDHCTDEDEDSDELLPVDIK